MEKLSPSREAGWIPANGWFGKPAAPVSVPTRSYAQVYSWCKVNYHKSWWVDEMESHIWKWETRIARRLAALRELAKRRMSALSSGQFLVREHYRAVLAMIVRAESRIAKLACRSAKRIKVHLARLAAALEQCSEQKPNGVSQAAPPPFTPPSDDPESDPTECLFPPLGISAEERMARSERECRIRRDIKSWKSYRRLKWRVLASFSVSPT